VANVELIDTGGATAQFHFYRIRVMP
jgi:hypothetical protein